MKISTKLFLSILILIILTSAGLGYISVRDERFHLTNEAKTQTRTLARILAATFKYYHMGDQHQRVGELIHAVLPHDQDDNNILLYLYDHKGKIMNLSFEHGPNQSIPRKNIEPRNILRGSSERIIIDGSSQYFSVMSPIINNAGEVQGAVEVSLSLDKIYTNQTGLIRKFIAFVMVTAFLLGLLIFLISHWSISLPIASLKEASQKLGRGDLGLRIENSGVTELDDLIQEFNRMAHNIERQSNKREELFTEKITLERRLRHSDKLASIGQLASGLAHEIGTPLNVISGRAEHLLKKLTSEHPGAKTLKNIIRQSERITKTIQQMLAFSRKPAVRFREIDLQAIINDAFSLCQLRQRKAQPQVSIKLNLAVKHLQADEDGMRQLFVNLMLNSFQITQNGGQILISSSTDNETSEMIIITYQDNGPGIPHENKNRIFDPFFTTKDVGEGTGLGLFMVANIVQEHQGLIELDDNFQKGTRFIIQLPVPNVITEQAS